MASWSHARLFVALVLGTGVGACFNAPAADVMFACDPGPDEAGEAACPAGYACAEDDCCHRDGTEVTPDNFGTCQIGGGPMATTGGTTSMATTGPTSEGSSGAATTGVGSTSTTTSGSTGGTSTGTSAGETGTSETGAGETGETGETDTSTGETTTGGTTAGETTG